jgi:hypothetical protein
MAGAGWTGRVGGSCSGPVAPRYCEVVPQSLSRPPRVPGAARPLGTVSRRYCGGERSSQAGYRYRREP